MRLSSFVGRAGELAEIAGLVRANRLVTVTGVGGVGKSRLATAMAAECAAGFADGVWQVDLAALAQPDLVAAAVVNSLGVRGEPHRPPVELLVESLRTRAALLVLDNCEHLVAEVADVADRLLSSCAGVHVLATSRERLGVTGEVVRGLSGLDLPASGAAGVSEIGSSAAVRLLVERTAALDPRFTLTEANADAVARLAVGLDGLPLAIELAAANVHALGAAQVADRLAGMVDLLVGGDRTGAPRHRTLWTVIDWSYRLLDGAQRRMFDLLSVFTGGFTLDAAEAVAEEGTVADRVRVAVLLTQLVDKSMVSVDDPGAATPRYRVLETLRSYASIRLAERGATAGTRDRHTAHFLAVVGEPRGATGQEWLHQLEIEHGNLRAAVQWSIDTGDAVTALRLASSLYPLWEQHGHYREGRRWLRLALAVDAPTTAACRARALDCAAALAIRQGDLAEAATAADEAAALSRRSGDAAGVARALTTTGLAAIYADDREAAISMLEEAVDGARRAGDRQLEGTALLWLTVAVLAGEDHHRAVLVGEECVAVLRPLGDAEGVARTTVLRAAAAWRLGHAATASELLRESLRDFLRINHMKGLAIGLYVAGQLIGDRGEHERAVSLLGAAEALCDSAAVMLPPLVRRWADAAIAKARTELAPAAFALAWEAHRASPAESVVGFALRVLAGTPA